MGVIAGGYFLLKPVPRSDYMSAELLPAAIVSISDCICDSVSTDWLVEWDGSTREQRLAAAEQFGVAGEALDHATEWASRALDDRTLGWPNVFSTVEGARRFREEFLRNVSDVRLLGIGLPGDYCADFLAEAAPAAGHPGFGVWAVMKSAGPVANGGRMLGYEILGLDFQSFHSSICNSLETDFAAQLGIAPNAAGFIDDEADARRCAEYAGLESTGSEPALWQPWQIVEYE